MSQSHLDELRSALVHRGWMIVAEKLRGENNVEGAATWQVRSHVGGSEVLIDFAGFGAMGEDISLEQSHGCKVRGRTGCNLYFRRINRSRSLWLRDLTDFVDCLVSASDS